MRAPPLEPLDRRLQLVAAARRVYARQGYHRASVANIVEEAGVARGTFYNYFDGKREIFQAVLDGVMEQVARGVVPIDLKEPVPPQLRENLLHLLEVLDEDVCRILFAEALGIDAEGDAALRAFYGDALGRIARALRKGQSIGLVRPGNVELLAPILLGMVKEPVFQAWLGGQRTEVDPLVQEMLALLGWGIVTLEAG